MKKQAEHRMKRREMLKAMTAVPAAALVPLAPAAAMAGMSHAMPQAAEQATKAYKRKVLDDHEWRTIQILSDLIIPADDRSGSATQAGVPEFIDDWLDFRGGELLAQIRGGIVWLDVECNRQFSHNFSDCSADEQKQILDRIAYPKKAAPADANAVSFFNSLRGLVASGFFSSKMGVKDLPYLGNQMVAEWQGCPPEVAATIQKNLDRLGIDLKLDVPETKT
jgi:gluconate 2-dehydrogenase subunit 3-like protein